MTAHHTEDTDTFLAELADRYESPSFSDTDPCRFLRVYRKDCDIESCAFTAAMLSFGSRTQFLPKIQSLCDQAGESFAAWIVSGSYRQTLLPPDGNPDSKFYRFYSYNDMYTFFDEMRSILRISGSLGTFFRQSLEYGGPDLPLDRLISECFPRSSIVSKGKNSANKRIHMFLRWMVRRNSPVDIGLWTWYSPGALIIPLDVHVLKEARNLGLIPQNAPATRKTAVLLTERMKQIWPDDPCKGDFALFGLGIDTEKSVQAE